MSHREYAPISPMAKRLLAALRQTPSPSPEVLADIRARVEATLAATGGAGSGSPSGAPPAASSPVCGAGKLGALGKSMGVAGLVAAAGLAPGARLAPVRGAGEGCSHEAAVMAVTVVAEPREAVVDSREAVAISSKAAPAAAPRARTSLAGKPPAHPPVTASPARTSTTAEENALIHRAERALRVGDVMEADGVLDEHASRFGHGALQELREALRIHARLLSGDTDGARAALHELERRYPRSAHLQTLREALAKSRRSK